MFLDHTQRHSTLGRNPLDEWSARRRDLYLTTHDTHNRQIFMPPVGFEPTISAGERPGIESQWGEIFRTFPDRPWGPHSLLYNGYRDFPRVKERPGRDADPSPLLVPWSWKSRAIPLLPLWAVRPVQSLSACTRVTFNLHYIAKRANFPVVFHKKVMYCLFVYLFIFVFM